jgi:hypothetical protein
VDFCSAYITHTNQKPVSFIETHEGVSFCLDVRATLLKIPTERAFDRVRIFSTFPVDFGYGDATVHEARIRWVDGVVGMIHHPILVRFPSLPIQWALVFSNIVPSERLGTLIIPVLKQDTDFDSNTV